MKLHLEGFKVLDFEGVRQGDFGLVDGTILPIESAPEAFDARYENGYIIPPIFDTHIHGGWGVDFDCEDSFFFLEKQLRQVGTCMAIPTMVNSKWERLPEIISNFRAYNKRSDLRMFPFLRIEGPFISEKMRGYQDIENIRPINPETVELMFKHYPDLKMFTFAPEIKGSELLVKTAVKLGMIPSVGHSNGGFSDFQRMYDLGVRHFTHFGNRMGHFHHRDTGLIGAGLYFPDSFLELIGDFSHSSGDFIQLVFSSRAENRLALISDSVKESYLAETELKKRGFIRQGGLIKTRDRVTAGGETTPLKQAQRIHQRLGIDPVELLQAVSVNPLRFFSISFQGAQVTVLDDRLDFISYGRFRNAD